MACHVGLWIGSGPGKDCARPWSPFPGRQLLLSLQSPTRQHLSCAHELTGTGSPEMASGEATTTEWQDQRVQTFRSTPSLQGGRVVR